jgi:hypothetical protein
MDHWFNKIAAQNHLEHSVVRTLRDQGFIVIPGPIAGANLARLADAYDTAVLEADPADVGAAGSTTRVHDFVNRGAAFDDLYLHAPILEAWINDRV